MERQRMGAGTVSIKPPPGFTLDEEEDTPPPPPPGFSMDAKPSQQPSRSAPSLGLDSLVGAVDGDTLRTGTGRSVRLWGVDAPELRQNGWDRTGRPVPIGQASLDTVKGLLSGPSTIGQPVGNSWGRPVAPIKISGLDLGQVMARKGQALVAPGYLRDDPERLGSYMDAERLARRNRLGMHDTFSQTPAEHRKNPDYVPDRETVARFWDTPTPFEGLRPEIERGYLDITRNGSADQILAYAKANGFTINPDETRRFVADRDKGASVDWRIGYKDMPRPLTNLGDGRTGATVRGLGDGVLAGGLDEAGALVDTLGLTADRENVWNSERRFADIFANNQDQNSAILGYDEMAHPGYRLGGQIAGGLVVPFGSKARTVPQLFRVGAAYGGAEGFLGTDGGLGERLKGAAAGVPLGGAVGAVGGKALEYGIPLAQRALRSRGRRTVEQAGDAVEGYADPTAQGMVQDVPEPPPGFRIDKPSLGEVTDARTPDRIDIEPSTSGYGLDAPERSAVNSTYPGPVLNKAAAEPVPPFSPDLAPRRVLERHFTGPLDQHTPRVWRETSLNRLELFLPNGNASDDLHSTGDLYVADHPDLALGQGVNKGVTMEFDTSGLQGRLDRSKPTADFGYQQGTGSEYVARYNTAPAYKRNLRSFRIAVDAPIDRVSKVRLPRFLQGLEAQGWRKTEGNGFVQFDRPDTFAPSQPAMRDRDWIDINNVPPPPPGFRMDTQAMDADSMPSLSAPVRRPDYLDMGPVRPGRMDQPLTDAQRQAMAHGIDPRDVLPIPSNVVGDFEEAAAIDAGRFTTVTAPDETTSLFSRGVKAQTGTVLPKKGPLDLVTWLRSQGGVKDQGGNLRAMGIGNEGRDMDFARGEQRFGPLVSDQGMNLDDAAFKAWEMGYLPGTERPDIDALLDAIGRTHGGSERFYLPEDLHEVAQFEGMRSDRIALEEMQANGPVWQDRSIPGDNQQPFAPPQAYEEWPAGGPDFAGNINLGKLDSPQDIARALDMTQRRVGFDAATRGRVSQAETERLAADLNMTPETLLSRRQGQAFNAEEALAARQILAKSGNELVNAAKRIRQLDDPGDELLADFRQKWVRHVAIQEQVAGMTAEAGRALQQFRQMADSRAVRGNVLSAMVRGGGGKEGLQDAANVLLDAVETEPGKFNALTSKAMQPKWHNRISEFYINVLLSNPATHTVNMVSNTMTALGQIPEHGTAALIGKARQALPGADVDRVVGSEVGARAFGLLQGAKEGARLFARALKTGEPSDFISKVEGQEYKAIPGIAGEVIRTPTRLLTAEDELFKGIARRMEMNGLAVRQARQEGLRGDAAKQRIAELIEDPTDAMLQAADHYGRYITFQTRLGPTAQKISAITGENLAAKVFMPFVRTPTNLLKYAVERSPAAPLLKEWRADFQAGGARRDLAVAKAMLGTGMGMAIYEGALSGNITGSAPPDPAKAKLLYADGWQPYSIRVGDKWYSYKRLDPLATTLGFAADLATLPEGMSERQKDDKVTLLVASIMGNLASKTWLSGISDVVGALDDPGQNADRLVQRLVGSFAVPAGVAGAARAIDPVSRETDSVGEYLQSRIPFASQSLRPRLDVWGKPIVNEGGIGPDWLSPVYTSTARNDPVNREMMALDYAPGTVGNKVGGMELTPDQQNRYQQEAGQRSYLSLQSLVGSPQWRGLDPEARHDAAEKSVRLARKEARDRLFGGSTPQGASKSPDGVPPPPPGFSVDGASGGRNVYADLQTAIPGVRFTSGYRTPEYQAQMRRRGYKPAYSSSHLDGSALDMLPPRGKSMNWLKNQVRRYDPDARLLIHDGHLHATFPGYYGAPVLGGARSAGMHNPLIGMPPPPPGFRIDR